MFAGQAGKTRLVHRPEVEAEEPVEIERVLVSTQHREGVDVATRIKPDLAEHVLGPILPEGMYAGARLLGVDGRA